MDLKQLQYFIAVVEEENISAAARKLHMSQPPLSHQIKLLEQELGIKLLERGPRKIILTDEGKLLYKRAHHMLELADTTIKELENCRKGHAGTLHIGTVSTSGAVMTDERVLNFHRAYPHIRFEIHEGNTVELIDWIEAGIIELAVIRTPFKRETLNQKYLEPEPLVALMRKDFDWCPDRQAIQINELQNRPLIYHRRFENRIENACHKAGFEPYIVCKSNDVRTATLWSAAGAGIALVPRIAIHYAGRDDMIYKEINCPDCISRLCIVWQHSRFLSFAARTFLDLFDGTQEDYLPEHEEEQG